MPQKTVRDFFQPGSAPHWKQNPPRRVKQDGAYVARATERRQWVDLGGEKYKTATRAKDACRKHIKRTPLGGPLTPKVFFDDLATHHSRGVQKVDVGKVVKWVRTDHNNGIAFVLEDGTVESMSWKHCIERAFCAGGADKARWANQILACFRDEVQYQVDAFRLANDTSEGIMHVDHDYDDGVRFVELVKGFIKREDYANAIYPNEVENIGGFKHAFVDRDFATRWQAYHSINAKLRMIAPKDNLKGNRGFKRGRPYG